MFTGIVEEIGSVASLTADRLNLRAAKVLEGTELGHSIAVNGVCLTVEAIDDAGFSAGIMAETLRRTNLGALRPGAPVNLERALSFGGHLGGHLVQGHVDAVGSVESVTPEGAALLVRVKAPEDVMRYVVEKGFIAVDGISLTVVDRDAAGFRVSIVGFTRDHTLLGTRRAGGSVNLEADIIAKYVAQLVSGAAGGGGITPEFLRDHGFFPGD